MGYYTPSQYLAIDCETTGLSPDHHSLLELAAMPLDSKLKKRDVEPFHALIRPLSQRSIDAKAIEVNKCTWAIAGEGPEWDCALEYAQAQIEFKKYIAKHFGQNAAFVILVGWNISFDEGFLKRLYTYYNGSIDTPSEDALKIAKWPFHYHKIDLQGICRYLDIRAGRFRRSYRLEALAENYFTPHLLTKHAMHTALGDCEMQLRVLEAMENNNEAK